ncbi:MAG: endonuclease V [Planctomycetes bacterium]|nr:endonuclease V [Planctomycetota bacterium]
MKIPRAPHAWNVSPTRAIAIQKKLAGRVVTSGRIGRVRLVAGADIAFTPDKLHCIAGVVVWDIRDSCVVEQVVVRRPVRFPYVPGLLSFREAPSVLSALGKLRHEPDAFMFDGQGLAHPRRFGLACHVGMILDRPSVGCAKSILVGSCDMPAPHRGSSAPLVHHGEIIGRAVRTRDGVRPVYVSVGHRLSLADAVEITLLCGGRYRLPEPTRLADQLVARERALC